jgi:hypothetical protein
MNMDRGLVNRALGNLGLELLTESDRADKTGKWETAKARYLNTMLETLERVEWTGAKRRRELAPCRLPLLRASPRFPRAYELPLDCSKPIELGGGALWEVEERVLHTDADPAVLLYVRNGRKLYFPPGEIWTGGNAGRGRVTQIISGGDAFRHRRLEAGEMVSGGNAFTPRPGQANWPPPPNTEDYPDYDELKDMEPNFYLYWECLLTALYAGRLAEKPGLAEVWVARAHAAGRGAVAASRAQAASRRPSPRTWQEELGLKS